MSRPFKHPDTGMYWLRKRVPDDLRAALGKTEIKKTLGTKNPAEAKRLHAAALAEIEAEWAVMRKGAAPGLTEALIAELEQEICDRWVSHHRDRQQTFWRISEFENLWTQVQRPRPPTKTPVEDYADSSMRRFAYECADEFAAERGLQVDDDGRLRLAKAASRGLQRASLAMLPKLGWGDVARGVDAPPGPTKVGQSGANRTIVAGASKPLPFSELVDGWARERKPVERTVYSYQRVLNALKMFLGHDDARRLTADDLVAWKNDLIAKERSSKTIRDAKLAPVRALLQWAVDNRRLTENVAQRITINVKVAQAKRKRSYTDDEAKVVLAAARKEKDPVRRWVPFLAAYSGARVAELCQLRAEDIRTIHDIPCMVFAAEAGSLKNANSERALPLHPALIAEGFLTFAATIKEGPLFADLEPDRFGSRGGNATKILSRWVRSTVGLKDERLSPNHSWRHRLKTLGRRYGLALDNLDAITGHGRKNVSAHYGEYEMRTLLRELEKIPDFMKDKTNEPAG